MVLLGLLRVLFRLGVVVLALVLKERKALNMATVKTDDESSRLLPPGYV